jgi:outer membrane protein
VPNLGVAATAYDPEVNYEEVRRKWWGVSITHEDGLREELDMRSWDTTEQPMK